MKHFLQLQDKGFSGEIFVWKRLTIKSDRNGICILALGIRFWGDENHLLHQNETFCDSRTLVVYEIKYEQNCV